MEFPGWTPSTFRSSRSSKLKGSGREKGKEKGENEDEDEDEDEEEEGSRRAPTAYDFMDEDERAEVDQRGIFTSSQFDTFGTTAAELARREKRQLAEREKARKAASGGNEGGFALELPEDLMVSSFQSLGLPLFPPLLAPYLPPNIPQVFFFFSNLCFFFCFGKFLLDFPLSPSRFHFFPLFLPSFPYFTSPFA